MTDLRAELRLRLQDARLEPTREREIVEELAQHLEDRAAELVARGATADDAHAAVLTDLDAGDALAVAVRRVLPAHVPPPTLGAPRRGLVADLLHDLRFAARALRKSPGFTAVTLITLALGIGANTAIFQLVASLQLRSLPVDEVDDLALVRIRDAKGASGWFNGAHPDVTHPLWERIRDRQQAFSAAAAWGDLDVNLAPGGEARRARASLVTGDYFAVLRVRAALGRTLGPADDRPGCPGAAVLSHAYWQRQLGGDRTAVGRTLTVQGRPVEIVGVAAAGFSGLEVGRSFDLVLPMCLEPALRGEDSMLALAHGWWLSVVGRLAPGWSQARASAHLDALSSAIFAETVPARYTPERAARYRQFRLAAFPASHGISRLRQEYSTPLWFLLGTAGLVLLIACANLANLLLARASAREREIAVRLALGASRGRLVRQLMAESLLIAVAGAALGLLLATALSDLLVGLLGTSSQPLFLDLGPDWRVLGFNAGVAALTCVLFGLTPALRAARTDAGLVLKAGARATAERGRVTLRRALVAGQVALSFVLLLGALLFARSLRNLTTTDLGFREEGIITLRVDTAPLALPPERRVPFLDRLLARVRATPGVDAAAVVGVVPISGSVWNNDTWPDGEPERRALTRMNSVSPGYFDTVETPLVAGRDFTAADTEEAPRVAIVDQRMASHVAGDENPIGRRFRVEGGSDAPDVYEIVGVVRDTKYRTLREAPAPTVYIAQAQDREPSVTGDLLIRTHLPLSGVVGAVKWTVAQHSPALVMELDSLERRIADTLLRDRLLATLAGFFGILGALLVSVGLYGVVSYSVRRRTREIGIRLALGARSSGVARMIVGEALWLLAVGLAAGVALALLAGRAAAALLYGLAPDDALTLLLAAALMTAVTMLAAYLPARRAARVDPMVALREE